MGIGASLFLLAVGAICYFALEFDVAGIDEGALGAILMVIGALGLIVSLLFWSSFSPYRRREVVVRDRDAYRERDVV